jgi:hypothetical protein
VRAANVSGGDQLAIRLAHCRFVFGDFAGLWQSFPTTVFVRHALAYASAGLMQVCGPGLSMRTEGILASAPAYGAVES